MLRVMGNPIVPVILAIIVVMLAFAMAPMISKSEYVIPGTISATCGPTLPEYTYCP